jgi:Mrp family chromosome partitioning ATPase
MSQPPPHYSQPPRRGQRGGVSSLLSILPAALVFLAFAAYGMFAPATYRASAQILLRPLDGKPLALPAAPPPASSLRNAAFDSDTLAQISDALRLGAGKAGQDAVRTRLDSALAVDMPSSGVFDFTFVAPTAEGAQRVVNLLARHAASRAVTALVPPPNEESTRETARSANAAALAAFVALHPELAPKRPDVVPVAPSDSHEAEIATLRAERDQIQAKLARLPTRGGDSDNPFDADSADNVEAKRLRRRVAEIDQVIGARKRTEKKTEAATPKVAPDVEREWKRLVEAVASPVPAASPPAQAPFGVMLREASLPSAPIHPNRRAIAALGAVAALLTAVAAWVLIGALRRRAARPGALAPAREFPTPATNDLALASQPRSNDSEPPRPGSEPPRRTSDPPGLGSNPPPPDPLGRTSSHPPTLGSNPPALGSNPPQPDPLGYTSSNPPRPNEPARTSSNPPRGGSSAPQPIVPVGTRAIGSVDVLGATKLSSAPPGAAAFPQASPSLTGTRRSEPASPAPAAAPSPPAPETSSATPPPARVSLRGPVPKGTLLGMAPLDVGAFEPKPSTDPKPATSPAAAAVTGDAPKDATLEAPARSTLRPPPPEAKEAPQVTASPGDPAPRVAATPLPSDPPDPDGTWTGPSRAHRRSVAANPRRTTQVLGSPIPPVRRTSSPPPLADRAPTERRPSDRPSTEPQGATTYSFVSTRPEGAPVPRIADTPPYYQAPRRDSRTFDSTPAGVLRRSAPASPEPRIERHPVPARWSPPPGLAAERRRALADELFPLGVEGCFVLGVTAVSDASNGKSALAAEVALALAEPRHPRVLLLEADFQWPVLHQTLDVGMPPGAGFSQQLRAHPTRQTGAPWTVIECSPTLHVMVEGMMRQPDLILSVQFEEGLRAFRSFYDFIVLDGPLVTADVDCRAMSSLVDGAVLLSPARDSLELAGWLTMFAEKKFSKVLND